MATVQSNSASSALFAVVVRPADPCRDRGRGGVANFKLYVMQPNELIRQFLQERVGADPAKIVNDALLADLGVDSLMLAELMFDAEDRLGISIESNATIPKTVGDMVALIDSLLAAKASQTPKP